MHYLNIAASEDNVEYISIHLNDIRDHIDVLITACETESKKTIQFLIEEKNALEDIHCSWVALKAAIRKSNFSLLNYLFNHGAKIEPEINGRLFEEACYYFQENMDIIQLLLQKNIFPDDNCFGLLIKLGHANLFKFLFKFGTVSRRQFLYSFLLREYEIFFFLHEKGFTLDCSSSLYPPFQKEVNQKIAMYDKIVNRTRHRAATKIYFWWIPICYDLNRTCGKNMMNNILNRIENYEKPI